MTAKHAENQAPDLHLSVTRYAVTLWMSASVYLREQFGVRLQRIANLHLRRRAFAREGMIVARRHRAARR